MALTQLEMMILRSLDDVWRTAGELPVTASNRRRVPAILRILRARELVVYRRGPGGDGRPRGEWAITPAGDRALGR